VKKNTDKYLEMVIFIFLGIVGANTRNMFANFEF